MDRNKEALARLEGALEGVSAGTLDIRVFSPEGGEGETPRRLRASTDGRGRMDVYPVFPGVTASFQSFLASRAVFHHDASATTLDMHHCRMGRIGWELRGDVTVYLGAGDLSLQSADCCADSVMLFPVGCAAGLTISVDLERLAAGPPEILREAGLDAGRMIDRFCRTGPAAVPSCPEMDCIFSPLYGLEERLRLPYLKLKLQELLLYLDRREAGGAALPRYVSRQTELIREIHDLLVEDLSRRHTIEELSRRYLINTSSLKEVFKAVYGLPIATYMKEYRVREAMRLLRETGASISDVAARVGYETQGKFTRAFKDVAQMLPSEYRRRCRSE